MPDPQKPGVIALPPSAISDSIRREVDKALAQIPPGKQGMAQVDIDLKHGVNVAYAMRTPTGWEAVIFVGKQWSGDIRAGAHVSKTW